MTQHKSDSDPPTATRLEMENLTFIFYSARTVKRMPNIGACLHTEVLMRQGEDRHSDPFPDSESKEILSRHDSFHSIWSKQIGLLSISQELYDGTFVFCSYHAPSLVSFPLLPTHVSLTQPPKYMSSAKTSTTLSL